MIQDIQSLANRIRITWLRFQSRGDSFSVIAADELSKPLELTFDSLSTAVCQGMPLPEQRRLDQGFGQPAITLFRDEIFTIEALCWHSSTPAIHQHAFGGAFRILTGASVHSRYTFTEQQCHDSISVGKLALQDVEVLEAGATREIPRGDRLIHSNFHLDAPTLTLVVRTHQGTEPELTYLPPGVSYDSAQRSQALQKRIELLDTMHQVGHPRYLSCLQDALGMSNLYDAMALVMRAGSRVNESTFRTLLENLRDRFGSPVEYVIQALSEERRRGALVRLRGSLTDPDQRYFVACLLSFDKKEPFMRAMTMRHGDQCAAEQRVCQGVASLFGGDEDNQTLVRLIVEAAIGGVPKESFPKWASARLIKDFDEDERGSLVNSFQKVCEHPFLSPLID